MWARVVEFMLAGWLAVSPFVFQHPADRSELWWTDWITAALIASFALLSYLPRLARIHLATVAVALYLVVGGRLAESTPLEAAYQNHMVVGLLLVMFAIVPNHASRPPQAWYSGVADLKQ